MEADLTPTKKRTASPATRKLISEAVKRLWADPETRQQRLAAIARGRAAPKVRKRMSQVTKRNWKDPKIRQARTQGTRLALANSNVRKRMGEASKRGWANAEVRAARVEGIRRGLADPDVRKQISATVRRSWANNPSGRQEQSEHSKKMWAERKARLEEAELIIRAKRDPRVTLAASLERQGMSQYDMKSQLFPGQAFPQKAYDSTKKLFRRKRKEISAEIVRFSGLSPDQCAAEIERARAALST